ncbi:hypothetical protein SNE40_008741 [Patella caerulea]|uniref:Uncharacterized protein n=1 Tax=Patella caerulea TaxID=87958 RepID=A0AAN8PWP6_PATCE
MSASFRICLWISILSSGYVSAECHPEDLTLFACRFFDGMFNGDCQSARDARAARLANQIATTTTASEATTQEPTTTTRATSLATTAMTETTAQATTTTTEATTPATTAMTETTSPATTVMSEATTTETTTMTEATTTETTTMTEATSPETTTMTDATTPETTSTEATTPATTAMPEATSPETTTMIEPTSQDTTSTTPKTLPDSVCNKTRCQTYGMEKVCMVYVCSTDADIFNSEPCNSGVTCVSAERGELCGSVYCIQNLAKCVRGVCRGRCSWTYTCTSADVDGNCDIIAGVCKTSCATPADCYDSPCIKGECVHPACDDQPRCLTKRTLSSGDVES